MEGSFAAFVRRDEALKAFGEWVHEDSEEPAEP